MNSPVTRKTHPMLLVAAIAVVLFCAVGIASFMGWLPSSTGSGYNQATIAADSAAGSAADSAALATVPAPERVPSPERRVAPVVAQAPVERARPEPAREPAPPAVCKSCGVVESVRESTQRAEGSGLGAGTGAVIGGLLGHQVGGGSGRQLATVAGAVGGAVLGNQVEGNVRATKTYTITVRMDNGSTRTFHQSSAPAWRSGDQVRVVNGALRAG